MAKEAAPRPVTRAVALTVLLLVVVQGTMLALQLRAEPDPHDIALGIAGPPLLAQALAVRDGSLAGHPLDARVVTDPALDLEVARGPVRSGDLAAVVVVDLRVNQDVLLVSSVADPDLTRVLRDDIGAVSASYGRSVRVETVGPERNAGTPRELPYVLVLVWLLLGIGLAAVLTIVRGPVARSWRAGAGRLVALAAMGVVVALLTAVVAQAWMSGGAGPLLGLWLEGAATTALAAWITVALEGLAGLAGIGVAATLLVALAAPLQFYTDPSLVAVPWSWVADWTPQAAALALANRSVYGGGVPVAHAVTLLVAWAVIPVLVLVAARRLRPRG